MGVNLGIAGSVKLFYTKQEMFVYRMVPSEDWSAYSPSSEALLLRLPYFLFSECVQFHLEILSLVA